MEHPTYGGYLDLDPYAPDKTYKGLNLIIPPLVNVTKSKIDKDSKERIK